MPCQSGVKAGRRASNGRLLACQSMAARRASDSVVASQCGAVIAVLLTNAMRLPSGDHDGTLIVPWPPNR